MLVELAYRDVAMADDEDALDYRFELRAWPTGETVRSVRVRIESFSKVGVVNGLRPGRHVTAEGLFLRSIAVVAVDRVQALGRAVLEDSGTLRWKVDAEEVKVAAGDRKYCEHQVRREGEFYCRAAERAVLRDESPQKNARKACTTLSACEIECGLPDTRHLCSGFVHLWMLMASDYPPSPVVGPRVCDKGHQAKVQEQPVKCTVDGHECWHRVLELDPPTGDRALHPLALNEALDFLSWIWKAKFPQVAGKLIQLASSAAAAEVGQTCASMETFRSRMNAVADLLDSMKIDVSLLASQKVDGTLNRMEDALRKQLPPPEFARAEVGLKVLRHAVTLRNALIHSDAGKKAPPAARSLGFNWPPHDWSTAWERVRDQCASAVKEIRQAIEATL
jgi:hypothetical protein